MTDRELAKLRHKIIVQDRLIESLLEYIKNIKPRKSEKAIIHKVNQ